MSGLGRVLMLAGPNGAGKSTLARMLLTSEQRDYIFVNADEIARNLDASSMTKAALDAKAGRIMLATVRQAVTLGQDVMIETTLSGHNWARRIPDWQDRGYSVVLYYLRLPSANHAVARVRARIAAGGHGIPEPTIRRRYTRSLEMLERVYKPLVDEWYVFDSKDGVDPVLSERWSD